MSAFVQKLQLHRSGDRRPASALKFALPIITETVVTAVITILLSTYIGKLSGTALTAMGTTNSIINFVNAITYMIITSSGVVVSHLLGADDRHEASLVAEQALGAAVVFFFALCAALAIGSPLLISLLIPTAEAQLFDESVLYFRLLIISFPLLAIYNLCCTLLRASGTATLPMVISLIMNGIHILFSAFVVTQTDLGLLGIGLSYIVSRTVAALLSLSALFKHPVFILSLKRIFKPNFPLIKRFLRIGIPDTCSSLCVQGGYLVANSMTVGLGTFEATTCQLLMQFQNLCGLSLTICSILVIPLSGRALGEGNIPKAKKSIRSALFIGLASCLLLSLTAMLMGESATALFSNDAAVISRSAELMWCVLCYTVLGLIINVFEPALKSGGDTKFLMFLSGLSIWIVRLPLTYLFCYVFTLGTAGVYLANLFSLLVRCIFLFIRYLSGKWYAHKI